MILRELKNKLFPDWLWDLLIVGGGCAAIGFFVNPLLGLGLALLSNLVSWKVNGMFEIKDFCLRLVLPLIILIYEKIKEFI